MEGYGLARHPWYERRVVRAQEQQAASETAAEKLQAMVPGSQDKKAAQKAAAMAQQQLDEHTRELAAAEEAAAAAAAAGGLLAVPHIDGMTASELGGQLACWVPGGVHMLTGQNFHNQKLKGSPAAYASALLHFVDHVLPACHTEAGTQSGDALQVRQLLARVWVECACACLLHYASPPSSLQVTSHLVSSHTECPALPLPAPSFAARRRWRFTWHWSSLCSPLRRPSCA